MELVKAKGFNLKTSKKHLEKHLDKLVFSIGLSIKDKNILRYEIKGISELTTNGWDNYGDSNLYKRQ